LLLGPFESNVLQALQLLLGAALKA